MCLEDFNLKWWPVVTDHHFVVFAFGKNLVWSLHFFMMTSATPISPQLFAFMHFKKTIVCV